MNLSSQADVAMILPLPCLDDEADPIRMINLARNRGFFGHLEGLFPKSRSASASASRANKATLKVETVGAFEASFVPTTDDFDRLDKRFRLSESVLGKLPQYEDWGFAVFQLAAGTGKRIHPFGLSFRPSYSGSLFFPTVHVHDGRVPYYGEFSHTLYAQLPTEWELPKKGWHASLDRKIPDQLPDFVYRSRTLLRAKLSGDLRNRDRWLSSSGEFLTE